MLDIVVGALLVELLIPLAVEINLTRSQKPTIAVIAAVEDNHGIPIAMPFIEQSASSVSAALADQHHAPGGAAVTNVMNHKNECALAASRKLGSPDSRFSNKLLDLSGRSVCKTTRPKKLAQAAAFTHGKPFV